MMPDWEAPKLTEVSAGPLTGGADGQWSVRGPESFLERCGTARASLLQVTSERLVKDSNGCSWH